MEDRHQDTPQIQDLSLNFSSDSLLDLADKIKSSVEGRIDWGDTFGIGLSAKNEKYLLVWTPKKSSESIILPGFDSEDGKLTLKMKPRPGAWVSWIDEARVATEATDDYDRVRKSVQELERNTRQVIDFADGVIKDITALHLGKSLTLSELAQEVLQVELAIPVTIKIGAYVLARSQDPSPVSGRVIIPEQTNIHRVHMNEDELFGEIANAGYDQILAIHRTHIKHYPDLLDINYSLTLRDYFDGESISEDIISNVPCFDPKQDARHIEIFPTAAVYDPLQPNTIQFVATTFDVPAEEIREGVDQCSSEIDRYVSKANQRTSEIMANFQGRIDSRLQALSLQPSQRVYEKVWDEIASHELRNRMFEVSDFFGEYLSENFDSEAGASKKDLLKRSIDPMIEAWQLQEVRQTTLRQLILSGYKLANQVLDRATALFYDFIFEKHFIEPGRLRIVELLVLEDNELLDPVPLPQWTKKTVRDRLHRLALNPSTHPKQIERLRNLWLELLKIANFASRHNLQFEAILKPLVDILLTPEQSGKPPSGSRSSRSLSIRKKTDFSGFKISDEEFTRVLNHLKRNFPMIKRWILNRPEARDKHEQYFATLWMILIDGTIREILYENCQPICNINLSLPLAAKRLIDLVLGGQIVVRDEKDLKSLKRNLDRTLFAKTGRGVQEITTPSILKIHSDTLLSLLREELLTYQEQLEKRLARITNSRTPKRGARSKKRRKKGLPAASMAKAVEAIETEKPKIAEIIAFLASYTDAPSILLESAINPKSQQLNEIRRHQVLNFDLEALPPIEETWLENIKSVDEYSNLRAFLLENNLPISTAGRMLMNFRKSFADVSVTQPTTANAFDVALALVQELKALQDTGYTGVPLKRFMEYIGEKLWRWELTQITEEELPTLIKEKVLVTAVCYEKDVEALLEYVERYDPLMETKVSAKPEMDKQAKILEEKFQALAETIL